MSDRVKVELVGGPDDGLVLSIDSHRYEWLMPWVTAKGPFPAKAGERPVSPEMNVSVYRRIDGQDKYRFSGFRKV